MNYIQAIHHNVNQIGTNQLTGSMNYYQAIINSKDLIEKQKFQEAYRKEIIQLTGMNIWSNIPIDATSINKEKMINPMFIFTVKRDGRHKCGVVAIGDQQQQSTYRNDPESNTVYHYALMTCLSLALQNEYDNIIQLDISSVYLYVPLEEELYMRSPPHLGLKKYGF